MRKGFALPLFVIAGLLIGSGSASAATTHFWRFETSPGFALDSVGGVTLTPQGDATQATLPATGRGSEFVPPIPGNIDTLDSGALGYMKAPALLLDTFTVEAFIHMDVNLGATFNVIATEALSAANSSIRWLLQVRSGSLTMLLCEGNVCDVASSGFAIAAGKDYFVATTVDLAGGTIGFHVQNLTDGGVLQSTSLAHARTSLNSPPEFSIGALSNGALAFDGLIDEFRISDQVLTTSELLINSPPPEPSSVPGLGTLGVIALLASLLTSGVARARRA